MLGSHIMLNVISLCESVLRSCTLCFPKDAMVEFRRAIKRDELVASL